MPIKKEVVLHEKIADIIMEKLPIDSEEDRIRYLKCKFGIQTILIDALKTICVYGAALVLDMLLPVLLFHLGYLLIRTFGYGAHADKNFICILMSVGIFIGGPYLIKNYYAISTDTLMMLLMINFIIIIRYAPSSTQLNPITDEKVRNDYRLLTMAANGCLLLICLLNHNDITNSYLVIGSFIASLFMLPLSHRILKGGKPREKND